MGHETDSCYALLDQIESLVQEGYLREYVRRRSRSPNQADKGGKTVEEEASKDGKDKSGTLVLGKLEGRLCSIIGGFAGGGVTSSARKKSQRAMYRVSIKEDNSLVDLAQPAPWRPIITFGPEDFKLITPHFDDPMVVMLRL